MTEPSGVSLRDLDLTRDEPVASGSITSLRLKAYDPAPDREKARRQVALMLVYILMATVFLSFGLMVIKVPFADVKDLLGILLPPLVGLVGSAIGFYFGEKS